MRKLAQFTDKDDLNSFMQKEYNDLVNTIQKLGNDINKAVKGSTTTITSTTADILPVTMIIMSGCPTEAAFQSEYGTNWVLADGRSVAGSEYQTITGATNIPDLRGRYPRGRSYSTGVNPDGDLSVGALQDDQFESHSHGVNINGGTPEAPLLLNDTGFFGTAQTGNTGGNETRPKTTIVNFFVKIN